MSQHSHSLKHEEEEEEIWKAENIGNALHKWFAMSSWRNKHMMEINEHVIAMLSKESNAINFHQ